MAISRRLIGCATLVAGCVILIPRTSAVAQAPTGILSLSVRHTTLKNTARPTGELKASIDSLDALIGAASRLGRTAELRRLYAHASTLLANREWSPESEYAASLVLRTDRQVIDPARRWSVRLEQIYQPSIPLNRALRARATLRQRAAGASTNAPLAVVKELGSFDGVSRDLRDTPYVIDAELGTLADGTYVMMVEVLDSARVLGTASMGVVVRNRLDATIAQLEASAASVAEPLRSDLLFPVDRLRHVNNSRIALSTFNAARAFAAAESLLVAVNAKRDPWAGRTGDMKRRYLLEAAGEIMPYRLYVPSSYNASTPMPLIIALHGLGATEDSFFDAYGRVMPKLAEERGYIVAAPLGYRVDGGYGVSLGGNRDPAALRAQSLSEQDVLQVLAQVRSLYKIDDARVFLMGHSMGAIGTWAIAAKHPGPWAGLGAFSGFGVTSTAPSIKDIPQFVVHGDADPTVAVTGSRVMVAALKAAGANVHYIEVPGGDHSNVVAPNLPGMFDFFDTIAREAPRDYLYLWTASADSTQPDFLAVLDVTEDSVEYGELVTTLVVPGRKNRPHHTEHEMPADGQLFANGFASGQTIIFDLREPRAPKIAHTFGEVNGYSHPHSFVRMPNGNVLATFQMRHDASGMSPGGLVEMTPSGDTVRSSSANVPGTHPELRVYSASVVPSLNRIVTTTSDMIADSEASRQLQLWRLSDLSHLHTFALPHGPRGDESLLTAEPRVMSDGRTVLVSTFNCGLYLLEGLDTDTPAGRLVSSFPRKPGTSCALPVISGRYYLVTVPALSAVVCLDISDPTAPREVSRVTLGPTDVPHWIAISPDHRRVVITGYAALANRVLIARFDSTTGQLALDERFREAGASAPGFRMDGKTWPHGGSASGVPHGAVFSRR